MLIKMVKNNVQILLIHLNSYKIIVCSLQCLAGKGELSSAVKTLRQALNLEPETKVRHYSYHDMRMGEQILYYMWLCFRTFNCSFIIQIFNFRKFSTKTKYCFKRIWTKIPDDFFKSLICNIPWSYVSKKLPSIRLLHIIYNEVFSRVVCLSDHPPGIIAVSEQAESPGRVSERDVSPHAGHRQYRRQPGGGKGERVLLLLAV